MEDFVQHLQDVYAERDVWNVFHLHLSRLNSENYTKKDFPTFFNYIRDDIKDLKAYAYVSHDNDIFIVFPDTIRHVMNDLDTKIHQFFIADPIVCAPLSEVTLSSFLPLEGAGYNWLFAEIHKRQALFLSSRHVAVEEHTDLDYFFNKTHFQQALQARRQRKKLQIMVAEDNFFSRKLIARSLDLEGDIILAKDGYEALQQYSKHAPDILFLDIEMPSLDGHQVLEHISSADPYAFVVMLTAKNFQDDVLKAKKNHAMGYITKPFTQSKLKHYIELYKQKKLAS